MGSTGSPLTMATYLDCIEFPMAEAKPRPLVQWFISNTASLAHPLYGSLALLKNLWLFCWQTLATMCGWATVGATLIQGTTQHWSLAHLTGAKTSGLALILMRVDFWMSQRPSTTL